MTHKIFKYFTFCRSYVYNYLVIDKVEELIVEETDKPAKKKPRKIKNKETAKIQAETKNIDQVSTQEKEDLNESVVQGKKLKKKINNIKIDEDQEKRGQKFLSVFSATESEKEEENENQQNEKLEGDYEPKENAIMIQASDEEKDVYIKMINLFKFYLSRRRHL